MHSKKVRGVGLTYKRVPAQGVEAYLENMQDKIMSFEQFLLDGAKPDHDTFVIAAQERHDLAQLQLAIARQSNPQVTIGDVQLLRLPEPYASMYPIVLSTEVACRYSSGRRESAPEVRGQKDQK